MAHRILTLLACLGLGAPALADTAPEWRTDTTVDGIKVERRAVPGSSYDELKVSTRSKESLQALCDAVWAKDVGSKTEGDFKKRVVISETGSERLTYEQIHVPVVSDRDYVIKVTLVQPAQSGRCRIDFETVQHPDYPPAKDFVRLKSVRGHWLLEPLPDGQVGITYQLYSDPGGSVPAFLAKGGQRDSVIEFVKTILQRAHRQTPAGG